MIVYKGGDWEVERNITEQLCWRGTFLYITFQNVQILTWLHFIVKGTADIASCRQPLCFLKCILKNWWVVAEGRKGITKGID